MPGVFTKIINGEKIMFNKGIKYFIAKEKVMLQHMAEQKEKVIDLDNIPDGEEDEKDIKSISEYTFNRTEYSEPENFKRVMGEDSSFEENSSSEETEEEFDWYDGEKHDDESYFVLNNLNRKKFKKGKQVFYCYGNRSNKFLLLNYGFVFPGNDYDSFETQLRLDSDLKSAFAPNLVDLTGNVEMVETCRLKRDQLNEIMLGFLRTTLKKSFYTDINDKPRVHLTKPTNLYYEKYVLKYYLDIL